MKDCPLCETNDPEARRDELLAEEASNEPFLLWMSFADPDKPKGQQSLGVIITRTKGLMHAVQWTHILGINPGGQIMSYPVPDDGTIKQHHLDRLIQKAELEAAGLA